jgi:hypothetical protein
LRLLILYAGNINRASGTSERILQIIKELGTQGVQITLSGILDYPIDKLKLPNTNLVSFPSSFKKFPSLLNTIIKLISNGLVQKYDIIQLESFSLIYSLVFFFLLHPFTDKFVIVFHDKQFKNDPFISIHNRLNLFLQKIILYLFDASITPGLELKKWFETFHHNLVNKMYVVPNGSIGLDIKTDIDYLSLKRKYNVDEDSYNVLFFGSMDFKPNYDASLYLYQISNFVSNQFQNHTGKKLHFLIAGMGSENLPKNENFITLGYVDQIDELLSLPDAIVLPHFLSYSGPHVKTIYAFLSKKPILATEDAVKDMQGVIPAVHFLKFTLEKPEALLNAVLNLFFDEKLCVFLGNNAFNYAKDNSWEKVSLTYLKIYKLILN